MAEGLLLLLTDDASGRLSAPAAQVDAALGGANLLELALMNKVDLAGEQDQGRPGRIIVRDPSPAGDEVLDAALRIVTAHQRPSTVIRPLGKNLRRTLYERLALSGVIRCEQARIPGVFPTLRWPAQDASHAARVRRLVTQALVQQTAPRALPDPRERQSPGRSGCRFSWRGRTRYRPASRSRRHGARPGRKAGLSWAGPVVRCLSDTPGFDLVGDGLAQRACVRGIDADGEPDSHQG